MDDKQVSVGNGIRKDQGRNLLCIRVCNRTDRRRYLVNFLVVMYGIGAVIGVNGIVAEIPLLVRSAPEGSALPANVAFAIMLAFVPSALYALSNRSTSRLKNSREVTWISCTLSLGTIAMVLLAFFHDITTTINSKSYSILLAILSSISALNASLRNILLMPYLRNFEEVNLASFFIGEGLSGFVPSVVALIQGVGGDPVCPENTGNSTADPPMPYIPPPKFLPRDFFLFLSALLAVSACSFWLLEYLRLERSPEKKEVKFHRNQVSAKEQISSKKLLDHESAGKILELEIIESSGNPAGPSKNKLSSRDRTYLCMLMYLVCTIGTAYLSVIETFSSRPYGNSAHNLVVNLSQLAATAICVLDIWLPPLSIRGVTHMTGLTCVAVTYVTWLALCSPTPPWRDTTHGIILLIITWILLMGLVSYVKLAITGIIWRDTCNDAGLYQLGFVLLLGTITGSIVAFVLTNFTDTFTPYSPC